MNHPVGDTRIAALRRFNRFYTKHIGVLDEGLLDSPFSLTEVRVLYELAHREHTSASELREELGLDAGYLSRILRKFGKQGFVRGDSSKHDARRTQLTLTKRGRDAFTELDERQNTQVREILAALPVPEQTRLLASMQAIRTVFGSAQAPSATSPSGYVLRSHQPGDMGWIVHRHGALYHQEFGWDERFEGLVAKIASDFIANYDPKREHCWIAEREGEILGSVMLVKSTDDVAKLRLLLVEPHARGLGIGKRLVRECTRFARRAGYKKITLWTQRNLTAARAIYDQEGYVLTKTEQHNSFGHELDAETWELAL